MKGTGKAPLVGLAVAAGLMTVVLGTAAKWPLWLWATPAAVAGVLALLLAAARSPRPEPEPEPVTDSDESLWEVTHVGDVALPSRVRDYDFRFSATVWWRSMPNAAGREHADPSGLAIETVLNRAREVTEREVPERLDLLRHRLNGVLGVTICDESKLVEAMGGQVELALSQDDRDRLGKLSEVRKSEEVWEHERRYERSVRAYLGDDVLKSPGSAVVWWLARHDDKVTEAADLIGTLARLSAAANDEPVDGLYQHLVPVSHRRDDDGGDGIDAGSPGEPGPVGPGGPARGPRVVGPINQLLEDIDLPAKSPEREVYVHRIAEFTAAMGRSEQARLMRDALLGEAGTVPGPVPGQQQRPGGPAGGFGARRSDTDGSVNGNAPDA
ncbi:hypothetical protein [Kitasatospora cinereorecta]|uniref:Secreted protein n=1 Tax=Kitasatospora cinereorecta TaxID=285560 RepID=A0ABW0VCZ2_9ACTN